MLNRTSLGGIAFIAAMMAAPVVSAQDSNALDQPAAAPAPVAPLTPEVNDSNPTFQWEVRSNATDYRLFVRSLDDGSISRYRFTSNGQQVVDGADVICPTAAQLGTICTFTPSDLDLFDGERFVWNIGARNAATGQTGFTNSPGTRSRYQQFAVAPTRLLAGDLFGPRGNIRDDDGNIRQAGAGPLTFEWANFGDASSYRLVIRTTPEGNLASDAVVPVGGPGGVNCTTTSGVFDTCTFSFDAEAPINSSANDFCWSVVAVNGRNPNARINDRVQACYAAL